ncbi:oxidoreductase [Sphingobium sp. EM0848]|uniref:oxidoreductase n=1 Tax=Sphingobium sp. EM0848 TaxID=2743473 RepID=UPI00159C234D|nr:oxidoreductase [Sphingobium sp. EM0848]
MTNIAAAGTFALGDHLVNRMGFGAMQLAGPGVFGPPKDRGTAITILREAVDNGVDHIDTSDFYGPHVTNQLIRDALYPYPDNLVIATKVGAIRGPDASWKPAMSREALTRAVYDNLRNLGLDVLEVVNLRSMFNMIGPAEGSIEEPLTVLAELQQQGLIRHIGLSNVTLGQVAEGLSIIEIVCVQNLYNLAQRQDEGLIENLGLAGIPYVPYFPLGGITLANASRLKEMARDLVATPLQIALAWLLHRSPNLLLIPGTSSLGHLRANLAAAALRLPDEFVVELNEFAT